MRQHRFAKTLSLINLVASLSSVFIFNTVLQIFNQIKTRLFGNSCSTQIYVRSTPSLFIQKEMTKHAYGFHSTRLNIEAMKAQSVLTMKKIMLRHIEIYARCLLQARLSIFLITCLNVAVLTNSFFKPHNMYLSLSNYK